MPLHLWAPGSSGVDCDSAASLVSFEYLHLPYSFLSVALFSQHVTSCPCPWLLARDLSAHAKKKAQTAANTSLTHHLFPLWLKKNDMTQKTYLWGTSRYVFGASSAFLPHTFSFYTRGTLHTCENNWLLWISIVEACYNTGLHFVGRKKNVNNMW